MVPIPALFFSRNHRWRSNGIWSVLGRDTHCTNKHRAKSPIGFFYLCMLDANIHVCKIVMIVSCVYGLIPSHFIMLGLHIPRLLKESVKELYHVCLHLKN